MDQIVDAIRLNYRLQHEQRKIVDCGYTIHFAHWNPKIKAILASEYPIYKWTVEPEDAYLELIIDEGVTLVVNTS